MTEKATFEIPARRGRGFRLAAGQRLKVINTHGTQVIDTWAFSASDPWEFMSMEHSRAMTRRIIPKVGDVMYSNKRQPILTLLEDTSPGIHDTIIAACDRYRYQLLGVEGHHDNCTDNLFAAMNDLGLSIPSVPCPLNLWMNIPIQRDHSIEFRPTVSKPGDFVVVRAEIGLVVVFSACPQDILPINGAMPVEAHVELL